MDWDKSLEERSSIGSLVEQRVNDHNEDREVERRGDDSSSFDESKEEEKWMQENVLFGDKAMMGYDAAPEGENRVPPAVYHRTKKRFRDMYHKTEFVEVERGAAVPQKEDLGTSRTASLPNASSYDVDEPTPKRKRDSADPFEPTPPKGERKHFFVGRDGKALDLSDLGPAAAQPSSSSSSSDSSSSPRALSSSSSTSSRKRKGSSPHDSPVSHRRRLSDGTSSPAPLSFSSFFGSSDNTAATSPVSQEPLPVISRSPSSPSPNRRSLRSSKSKTSADRSPRSSSSPSISVSDEVLSAQPSLSDDPSHSAATRSPSGHSVIISPSTSTDSSISTPLTLEKKVEDMLETISLELEISADRLDTDRPRSTQIPIQKDVLDNVSAVGRVRSSLRRILKEIQGGGKKQRSAEVIEEDAEKFLVRAAKAIDALVSSFL